MKTTATRHRVISLLGLTWGLSVGCSPTSTTLVPPPVSPSTAAAKAIELYDSDQDGALSKKELEPTAGLLQSLARYDSDGDKKISAAEIEARLQKFVDSQLSYMAYACQVSINGTPLPGAEVEFVPEPYLQGMIGGARGTSDENGIADMTIDASQLPAGIPIGTGVQFGTYQIRVTHPTQRIPDKYHEKTTLGVEISPIDTLDTKVLPLDLKAR